MQTLKTTCEGCSNWLAALPLGYKIYAAINYLMLVFVSGFPSLQQVLPNSAIAVIERLEFWRLFSSFLINGHFTAWNVILMNVCLWLLSLTMAHLELKLSTVYILAQLIKQTVLINLVIDLTFYPIIYFNILGITYLQTGGIMIPTMFFLMQDVAKNPDELFKIFGMTCFLKKKYLAVIVMIAVLAINSGSIIIVLVLNCFIMGQYMCRKLPFFALPLSLYCAINRKIPDCLKNMSGFVDVEAVKDNLSEVCIDWCKKDLQQQPIIQEKRKAIKATIQQQYKHHWINKAAALQQHADNRVQSQVKIQNERPKQVQTPPISFQKSENITGQQSKQVQVQDNIQKEPEQWVSSVDAEQQHSPQIQKQDNIEYRNNRVNVGQQPKKVESNIKSAVALDEQEEWS